VTPIAFTLTEVDMIGAGRLGMVATYRKNIVKSIGWLVGLSAVVAAIIVAFGRDDWSRFPIMFGALLLFYTLLLGFALPLVWLFVVKRNVRKNMRQIAALSREQHFSWTTEGFEVTSSQGISRFPFDEIHQWAVNDTSLILYPADHLFFAFPLRIFESEAQTNEFIAALDGSSAKRI
jgi:hypothetical protein